MTTPQEKDAINFAIWLHSQDIGLGKYRAYKMDWPWSPFKRKNFTYKELYRLYKNGAKNRTHFDAPDLKIDKFLK